MNSKIENILAQYSGSNRDSLIPILQEIQDAVGYLPVDALTLTGRMLKLPTSKIYGVATFYNQFRFEARGKYHISVCRGTACHVLGSSTVLQELEKTLKISAGQTTNDGLFSLEVVACIGACGLAPVISINGEFYAKIDAKMITKMIQELREIEMKCEDQ